MNEGIPKWVGPPYSGTHGLRTYVLGFVGCSHVDYLSRTLP
jgi:hypothetical protein